MRTWARPSRHAPILTGILFISTDKPIGNRNVGISEACLRLPVQSTSQFRRLHLNGAFAELVSAYPVDSRAVWSVCVTANAVMRTSEVGEEDDSAVLSWYFYYGQDFSEERAKNRTFYTVSNLGDVGAVPVDFSERDFQEVRPGKYFFSKCRNSSSSSASVFGSLGGTRRRRSSPR